MICKSEAFGRGYYPIYSDKFSPLKQISLEEFNTITNTVKPSLVRLGSDELTYGLHIIIRYELERDLMKGTIKTENLEQEWNKKYEEYLGVTPTKPSKGLIQDTHWADGLVGYFPTYILGSIYSAMIYNAIKKEHPQMEKDIENLDFKFIKDWLKNNIHQYGATKNSKEIIKSACGKDLDVKDFTSYLKNKYYKIYDIKQ
jgi:carboxypeptidase Taq